MNSVFQYSLNAILPILLEISLGFLYRRIGSFDENFYSKANSICFHLFLPINLAYNMYNVSSPGSLNWYAAGYLVLCIPFCILLGALAAKLFVPDRTRKAALVQCSFRSNVSVIGLTLAAGLGNSDALAFASLLSGVTVAAFNVAAVTVLNLWSVKPDRRIDIRSLVKGILTNPLIVGICFGAICMVIRLLEPQRDGVAIFTIQNQLPAVYSAWASLSRIASPMMLFCIGARLDFGKTGGMAKDLLLGVLLRLVLVPALIIGGAVLLREPLGITAVEMPGIIAFAATPTAVSGPVMVREIAGGDEQFACQLVISTSVCSMASMFVIIALLRSTGLL